MPVSTPPGVKHWRPQSPPAPAPFRPPAPPAPPAPPQTTGIDILRITDEVYGKAIPISLGGRRRMGGYPIFGPYIRYESVGSGFVKRATWAVSFGFSADPDGIRSALEIRLDSKIAYSALLGIPAPPWLRWRFYQGTEVQLPDPIAVAKHGAAANAFRGQIVIYFDDVPLTLFNDLLPFVAVLICDKAIAGITTQTFDTPTSSAVRSMAAVDWVGGIMYSHGRESDYRLLSHRISDRTQLSDVAITNLATVWTRLEETPFLYAPEFQVLFGIAGNSRYHGSVALDPDSAAILAESDLPLDTLFSVDGNPCGGGSYTIDTTTGRALGVLAMGDVTNDRLHLNVYDHDAATMTRILKSTDDVGGLGNGDLTGIIRANLSTDPQAKFYVAAGTKLILVTVLDILAGTTSASVVYTAAANINNLYGDKSDDTIIVFLSDGTAIKLDSSYAAVWSVSPGFTVDSPNLVPGVYAGLEGWRRTQPYFIYIDFAGTIHYLDTTNGSVSTQAIGLQIGGHIVFDTETLAPIITDNADPRTFRVAGSSDDTILKSLALEKLAEYAGLDSDHFATSGITGTYIAIIIASDTSFQDLVASLAEVEGWDVLQVDGKLKVINRPLGASLILDDTIEEDDIREGSTDTAAIVSTIAEAVELPSSYELNFIDPARDYNRNVARYKVPHDPLAISSSITIKQWTLPIVITHEEAMLLMAAKAHRDRAAREVHSFTGMPSLMEREPGDIVSITTDFKTIATGKVLTTEFGADYSIAMTVESLLATGPIFDPAWWVPGAIPTDPGLPPVSPPTVPQDGSDFMVLLDGPLLSRFDDLSGNGLRIYYAVGTRAGTYTYHVAGFSMDNFASGKTATVVSVPVIGTLTAALGTTATPFMTDYVNSLTFNPVSGDASVLAQLTYLELMNETQLFAVGRPGRWEIIGAGVTKTVNADGTITFTGLMRGMRGSEVWCGSHAIGDRVVLLKVAGATRVPDAVGRFVLPVFGGGTSAVPGIVGDTLYYAVGSKSPVGTSYSPPVLTGTFATPFVLTWQMIQQAPITATAEKPYAPCQLAAVIAGSDINLSGVRRDRLDSGLGGGGDVPMSEASELYDIVIMDGASVKREYNDEPDLTKTYPAADIATDWGTMPAMLKFRMYQRSAVVGRGFVAEKTVTLS